MNRQYDPLYKSWLVRLIGELGLQHVHAATSVPRGTLWSWVQQVKRDAEREAKKEADFRRRRAQALCLAEAIIERHDSRPVVLMP
jgi:hypothetical protein